MCAAIQRSLEAGIPLTDPAFYKDISEEKLSECLRGDDGVDCPMIKERVECLHRKGIL